MNNEELVWFLLDKDVIFGVVLGVFFLKGKDFFLLEVVYLFGGSVVVGYVVNEYFGFRVGRLFDVFVICDYSDVDIFFWLKIFLFDLFLIS